jgi:probable rRNA maturation factor
MKVNIELNDKAKCPFKKNYFEKITELTLDKIALRIGKNKIVTLSLALVDEKEIRKINKKYRRKNSATDVLSFSNYESSRLLIKEKKPEVFLGELLLCYNYVKRFAERNNIPVKKEMAFVLSHGILHLLGLRHSRKMFAIQDKVAQKIN